MTKEGIKQTAKDKQKKKTKSKFLKIIILIILLFLINIYFILGIIYKGKGFTVTLDSENGRKSNLTIYEKASEKIERTYLKSESIDYFSDISINWIPENIDEAGEGSHNGENYIAYTFYAENQGQETINYWSTIVIEDVIKDVDEAIRIMIYKNGERVVYAKANPNGEPERGTIPFKDEETAFVVQNKDFKVGDIDKYTVVIFVEGDDPECTDALIGGEISMHMRLTEEHLPEEPLGELEDEVEQE